MEYKYTHGHQSPPQFPIHTRSLLVLLVHSLYSPHPSNENSLIAIHRTSSRESLGHPICSTVIHSQQRQDDLAILLSYLGTPRHFGSASSIHPPRHVHRHGRHLGPRSTPRLSVTSPRFLQPHPPAARSIPQQTRWCCRQSSTRHSTRNIFLLDLGCRSANRTIRQQGRSRLCCGNMPMCRCGGSDGQFVGGCHDHFVNWCRRKE